MRGLTNWTICLALALIIWLVFHYSKLIGTQDETKFGKIAAGKKIIKYI